MPAHNHPDRLFIPEKKIWQLHNADMNTVSGNEMNQKCFFHPSTINYLQF